MTPDRKPLPTRDRLMDAAVGLVAREGLAAATTAAIAQQAGFAEGTLYRHFESKDDLLIAAYRETKGAIFLKATRGAAESGLPPAERLKRTWLAIYAAYRADPDAFRFSERFKESPLMAREGGEITRQIVAMFSELLAEGVARGEFKDLPVEMLIALCVAPIYFLLRTEIDLRPWTDAELDAAADAILDSWKK